MRAMLGDVALELHGEQGVLMEEDKSVEVLIHSSDTLYKLYQLMDENGFTHRYSAEYGELEVLAHKKWILFYVDKRKLDEERQDQEAFEDAQRIAEGYWRQ